jgi:hypothetical protein
MRTVSDVASSSIDHDIFVNRRTSMLILPESQPLLALWEHMIDQHVSNIYAVYKNTISTLLRCGANIICSGHVAMIFFEEYQEFIGIHNDYVRTHNKGLK